MKFTPSLPLLTAPSSRYHQDWEELEFLVRLTSMSSRRLFTFADLSHQGKGGFGSVVKARLKHDNRIYAVRRVLSAARC